VLSLTGTRMVMTSGTAADPVSRDSEAEAHLFDQFQQAAQTLTLRASRPSLAGLSRRPLCPGRAMASRR
jgi:hypothetical protein